MANKKKPPQPISLIREAVSTFILHPVILLPFITIAFVQVLILEILFFSPRFPLSGFLNPIVRTLWGEAFLHYPRNFVILPKLFQYIQVPIYIFVSSFFIAVAIAIIAAINENRKITFPSACRNVLPQYAHVFVGALISFGVFFGIYKAYTALMAWGMTLGMAHGAMGVLKPIILRGAPYFNLLIGAFVTTIFAFVFPMIVIEKKKIFPAIGLGLKRLWGSFWCIFFAVLLPTLLYLPVLLVRGNAGNILQATFPEMRALVLVVSVLVTMLIDATVYTSVTTYYLFQKEQA